MNIDRNVFINDKGPGPATRLFTTFLGLLGTAFCLYNALGAGEEICFTGGCSLHNDVALFGLSLWWWGGGVFAVIALLALSGGMEAAYMLAFVALAGDIIFLVWMNLTAPCFSCLLVALLFLFVLLSLVPKQGGMRKGAFVLAFVWMLFFSPNVFEVIKEQIDPWPIYGDSDAQVQVFFTPECSSCLYTVSGMIQSGTASESAFFPIAEDHESMAKILMMKESLEKGASFSQAMQPLLDDYYTPEELRREIPFRLKYRLNKNKAELLRSGSDHVPYIRVHGEPPWL